MALAPRLKHLIIRDRVVRHIWKLIWPSNEFFALMLSFWFQKA